MFADLHLHTVHSDGTYQPADLVASARRHELAAIALTDHDTLEGCAEVGAEARAAGLDFVVGTEITAGLDGRELHILGYLVDPAHAELSAELERAQ
ncbi:MAG: PHP domain-containing protein, partial [Verrucomicrobiales bacterium]|nr:PHP domain-containing protein [Verrucomicrobiales bacterium]